jgi:hypothetical protein
MAAPAKRDLNELAHHPDYNVKVQMERRETDSDAQHRRLKDLISFVAVLVALGLLMVAALAVVLVPGLAPESKHGLHPHSAQSSLAPMATWGARSILIEIVLI